MGLDDLMKKRGLKSKTPEYLDENSKYHGKVNVVDAEVESEAEEESAADRARRYKEEDLIGAKDYPKLAKENNEKFQQSYNDAKEYQSLEYMNIKEARDKKSALEEELEELENLAKEQVGEAGTAAIVAAGIRNRKNSVDALVDADNLKKRKALEKEISDLAKDIILASRIQQGKYVTKRATEASDFEKFSQEAPEEKKVETIAPHAQNIKREDSAVKYMSEQQRAIYNYYLNKFGKKKAEEYLDIIRDDLNQEQAKAIYSGNEDKVLNQLLIQAASGFEQAKSGFQGTARAFLGDESNQPVTTSEYLSQMADEDLADFIKLPSWVTNITGWESVGQIAGDAIKTTTNMIPSVAAGMVTGGIGGALAIGASSGGNSYNEAIREGFSIEQARNYAVLTGISETTLSYVLGGIGALGGKAAHKFLGKKLLNIDGALKKVARVIPTNYIAEGAEEYLQEILNPIFRNLIFEEDNEINLLSPDAIASFILGGLSSVGFSVGETVYANYDAKQTYKDKENMDALIESGLESADDTVAHKLAAIAKEKIESGKNLSGGEIRKLENANEEAIAKEQERAQEDAGVVVAKNATVDSAEPKTASAKAESTSKGSILAYAGKTAKTVSDIAEIAKSFEYAGKDTPGQIAALYNKNGKVSAEEFSRGISEAYRYGASGISIEEMNRNGSFVRSLEDYQRTSAYYLGQNNAEKAIAAQAQEQQKKVLPGIKGKVVLEGRAAIEVFDDPKQTSVINFVDKVLSKVAGMEYHIFSSFEKDGKRVYINNKGETVNAPNGWYNPETRQIWIDLHAGSEADGKMIYTLTHEHVHDIKVWSAQHYNKLVKITAEAFSKSGKSFEEAVAVKLEQYRKNHPETDLETAREEVVAETMSGLLQDGKALAEFSEQVYKTDRTLWEKIKDWFKDIIGRITAAYKDVSPDSEEARMLMEQKDLFEQAQKVFAEAVATAGQNYKAYSEMAGVQIDKNTDSVAPSVMFSERTWSESEYVRARTETARAISKELNVSLDQAYDYIDSINGVAKLIADDRVRLDYEPNLDENATVLKPNSEYGVTVDMSTLCAKRLLTTGTFDAIQKRLPETVFDSEDIVKLRKMMMDRGYEVACGICYVESTRREMGRITQEFIDRYKIAQQTGKPIARVNASGQEVILKSQGKTFMAEKGYTPNLGELNTTDIDYVKRDHPEVYNAYLAFMNARGQAKPKLLETRAEYKGEILKQFKRKDSVEKKNLEGGLRLQSFSDFELPHLIDMMQIVMDMSRVGLKSQAYTKVPKFAEAFGDTGIKINLSLIAKGKGVDANGNLIFDDIEGINHEEAFRIRERFSNNVGTILVGKNDEHIRAAMADPRIDMIIPFHKSSWKESLYEALGLTGYTDYTKYQMEKPIDKSRGKIDQFHSDEYWDYSKSGDENAQIYLQKCREDGRTPVFPQFQNEPGYWKMLIDFKMYDNDGFGAPHEVVKPVFNNEYNAKILDEYKGGHRKLPVAQDVVEDFVKEYDTGIRFQDRDSAGNELSKEQQNYFKNSVVRDAEGRLLPMYHGTANGGAFTIFEGDKLSNKTLTSQIGQGFYFTNVKEEAQAYTRNRDIYGRESRGSNPYLHEVYLNITNPLNVKDDIDLDSAKAVFRDGDYDWFFDSGLPFELNNRMVNGVKLTRAEVQNMSKEEKVSLYVDYLFQVGGTKEVLKNMPKAFHYERQGALLDAFRRNTGYDGIVEEYKPGKFQYVAMSSEQIKNLDNKTPTSNPDIRYSLRAIYSKDGMSEKDVETADNVIKNLRWESMAARYGVVHTAAYTAERIERELNYSSARRPDYAKSYVAWVNPSDFVFATTVSEKNRENLKEEAGTLDVEKLSKESQPIYLIVDFESGRILGHEGRHRMLALEKAGIEKVAVIIDSRNDDTYNTKPVERMRLEGQRFSDYEKGSNFSITSMLPLSARYADVAKELFTQETDSGIRYSDRDADGFKEYDIVSAVYTIRNEKAERNEDLVKIGNMPSIYRNLFGLSGDVFVSNSHLYKNMVSIDTAIKESRHTEGEKSDYHELGEQKIINAIEQFQNPMVIMESLKDYKTPRLVVILDEKGHDGQNLIGVMELYETQTFKGAKKQRNHIIMTIYEKNDLPDYIGKTVEKNRVLYIDKRVSTESAADLQLVGALDNKTLEMNIAQFNKKVKAFKEEYKINYQERLSVEDRNRVEILENKVKRLEGELKKMEADAVLAGQMNQGKAMAKEMRHKAEAYEKAIAKKKEQISEVRARRDELLEKARKEKAEAVAKVRQEARDRLERAIADVKAEKNAQIDALREKHFEKETAIKEKYRDSIKKATEGRHRTLLRGKIKRVVNELNTLLTRQTKEKHVPLELQKPVAEALSILNLDDQSYYESRIKSLESQIADAKTSEQSHILQEELNKVLDHRQSFKDKLEGLRKAYEAIEKSADPYIKLGYDSNIAAMIDRVGKDIGDTYLRDMSMTQLEEVYDLYKAVLKTVRDANKFFADEHGASVVQSGFNVIDEIEHGGKTIDEISRGKLNRKKFYWNNLKPVYAFKKLGSKTLEGLFDGVLKGQGTWAKDITEAKTFFERTANKYDYKTWNKKQSFEFTSNTGKTFSLNLQQMMSLYAYSKRDQAYKHLTDGGFVFDNHETIKRKGKEYVVNTAKAYNISAETLQQIIGKLSSDQMHFVDEMQKYLSETMGEKGNEISRAMYDINLFGESEYFPLKSAKQFTFDRNEVTSETKKLVNSGFTKPIQPGANNPIILTGFMDVWANHVNDMSMYHAFVLPIENFNKVYNFQMGRSEDYDSKSVKSTIQSTFTSAANDYIEQLIKDINGGARTDSREGTYKKLIGNWKKAAVFASASVVIQQPSAIGRAFAEINAKYFVMPTKVSSYNHKKAWEQIKKYAPVAVIKEMGYFDTDMGQSTADYIKGDKTFMDKADDLLSFAPAVADEYTWSWIWDAVKRETKAKHIDLNVNSEEFLKIAGERFTEIIDRTQVYDSVLSRSGNMRSKGLFMQMLTAFMAEPTTSANMAYQAMLEAKAGHKKKAMAYIGSVGTSVILNTVLVSLIYAMRDDDDDERFEEKYTEAFVKELIDGINPLTYIPFIKDVMSIFQGWDVERVDMSLIADLYDNLDKTIGKFKDLAEGIGDGSLSEEEIKASFEEILKEYSLPVLDTLASIVGVPFKNIRRDIVSIFSTYDTFKAHEDLPRSDRFFWDIVHEAAFDQLPFGQYGMESKDDKLFDALSSGDDDYLERLKKGYSSEDAYSNAIRAVIKDGFISGEFGESQSKTFLMNYGGKKLDDAEGIIKSWSFEKKWGFAWSDRADAYATGQISKTRLEKAVTDYTGKTGEDAQKEVDKIVFKSNYGFDYSDRRNEYFDGNITRKQLKKALMDVDGKTSEEADMQIKLYDLQKEGFTEVTEYAVKDYYEFCEPAGIPEDVYFVFFEETKDIKGDYDSKGESIPYSKTKKIMPYINKLPLTAKQKTAIAKSFGWADSTIRKYRLW